MAGDKINDVPIIIEKFDGNVNFTLWQIKMKNVLIQQDLQHAILGVEKKSTETTNAQWERMDVKVKSSIKLHLADNVMLNVDEDMNAKETCDKLEKFYKSKTLSNKLFLKDELLNLQMEEGGNLQDHLSRFHNCVANLLKVDVKYEDDDKVFLLLRSPPRSFKHFRTTIMFGKESLKLDKAKRGRSHSRRDKSGNRGRSEKENKGCCTCGATDHWKKNCKIWQERKVKAMARNSSTANVVISDESDRELLTEHRAPMLSNIGFWIPVVHSMCANKEWFHTYEERSCGEVLMRDDSSCKI
ncbi:hypothetical protein LWI28_007899 [Acer negundo]|uniref:Polyprotein n=1 Tax=Acer negundo TaxID=4023 RepID=A0AAD5JJA5_ACENE|nr:hypothetical protein LWI28_007899 [Acer negundo]